MMREGRSYVAGRAEAPAMVLRAPLSFYGGVAPETGAIVDQGHPDRGRVITGHALVIPGGKGSSSSSSVLAEAIRLGTGPAAIVLGRPDPIMVIGSLVAERLYGIAVPIIACPIDGIADDDMLRVECSAEGVAMLQIGAGRAVA
jgi:uncharacterized protein